MIRLPADTNEKWFQPNNSDKFGSLWYTKNINLDEEGYIKLSPRTVTLYDEETDTDFGVPLAVGRFNNGQFLVATHSDANFNLTTSVSAITVTENTGTNEPTMTADSHAIFWQNSWLASTATAVLSRAISTSGSENWTSRITGLTNGMRHHLCVFASRTTLCVTNGNVIKQYNTSYTNTTDLTIPSDFEAVALAYNNGRLGVITRLGGATEGQNQQARFYIWDGATTAANTDAALGSHAAVAICAYKSSFAILTQAGQLLYWNGGGFEVLANFPFYYTDKVWGDILSQIGLGDLMLADGDIIYINIGLEVADYGRRLELGLQNSPSGVWCYDPKAGLYHRYSPSISQAYLLSESSVDTSTDIITVSGTIPATGNIARYTFAATAIGGLSVNEDYYIIKVSATTMRLATSRENALAGTYINLTSAGSTSRFWAYDLVDYGNTHHFDTGGIALVGENNTLYQDILFGGDFVTTALSANDALCVAVPFLENRGYFVTPRIYPRGTKDTLQPLIVKFRPLDTNDKIVVKVKDRDVFGLPVVSPNGATTDELVWTSPNEGYTTSDLSEAKDYFDDGGELEMEFTGGAGAGQMVKISEINESGGTYSLVLAEDVIGASGTLKSYFIIDNWRTLTTITSDSNDEGQVSVPVDSAGKFVQFKIELRGYNTTIEELLINHTSHKP